jgi:ubiquinone/menaquinone biosynthesis C-methylase UbiE
MHDHRSEFDEKAQTWDDKPERAQWARLAADAIGAAIPSDPSFTAMEYGCGTGLLSFCLKDRFAHMTLVDNSPGMLNVLRDKIQRSAAQNLEVVNIDLLENPSGISTTFSVIYSSMVLHHIGDIDSLFAIWYRLLNKPGYLCIADLDSDNGLFHGKEFAGHKGFDRDTLKCAVEAAGFVDVTVKTVFDITKEGNDGALRAFPVFLMVGEKR